eukprot:157646-Chlamydomonas_euryale.AAC.6
MWRWFVVHWPHISASGGVEQTFKVSGTTANAILIHSKVDSSLGVRMERCGAPAWVVMLREAWPPDDRLATLGALLQAAWLHMRALPSLFSIWSHILTFLLYHSVSWCINGIQQEVPWECRSIMLGMALFGCTQVPTNRGFVRPTSELLRVDTERTVAPQLSFSNGDGGP